MLLQGSYTVSPWLITPYSCNYHWWVKVSLLCSGRTFNSTWVGWLWLQCFAHCSWSFCFRYSVRVLGSWVYGWYGLQGHGRYPRHMRWFKGDLYVLSDFTRLTQELRPKVSVCYWYNLSTATQSLMKPVVLLCKQIGIWTPLMLVVMVMVGLRLILYREWVDKNRLYKYNSIWGEWIERKDAVQCICIR